MKPYDQVIMKILVLCTGNTCRSQMAEGFLKSFDQSLQVYSAGTHPGSEVHPKTIRVMREENIDLSKNSPSSVEDFINEDFDHVITVCDGAKENCPIFSGKVKNRLHIGFEDPAKINGSDDYILSEYRRIRDEIKREFKTFYNKQIKNSDS